ncbi:hypothetical protein [Herbiconiux sp.]|uniref:hypothetical protein n=1 Tax=Herbiconiux sp. TaxID=1871186 RepID=UPI0025B8FB8F|nr:hypothetical protein [Herbiconiux sp.]
MSRNYMRVVVSNESGATLRLHHAATSGEWTPGGWTPASFLTTTPGGTLQWQAEGDSAVGVAFSGVEARAWYEVVDASGTVVGEFYIFANSPWVESQYGNTFHVHAPAGYYAAYVDAEGQKHDNRAELRIAFRNTARVAVPGFVPSVNGFGFANTWSDDLPVVTLGWVWNRMREAILRDNSEELGLGGELADRLGIGEVPEDWIPITHADAGLCGGMTFTAIDYFLAGRLPDLPAMDATGSFVSPSSESDPLFRHVRDRLLDSFDVTGRGSRWLSYSSPVYPDDDEGALQTLGVMKGKAWVTYREEWPRIRRELDEGRLVPLGLVQSDEFDIGANHQVLAYAYEQSAQTVKLWVYDPNVPKQAASPALADDLYYEFDTIDTSHGITVTRHNGREEDEGVQIFAILVMDAYVPKVPPGGVPIPPPSTPKTASLTVDAESSTTGGEMQSQTQNKCGEPKRTGIWTSSTRAAFVVRTTGLARPSVAWSVAGLAVEESTTFVDAWVDGGIFRIACRLVPGGRTLELTSGSGESYRVTVAATATDADGTSITTSGDFEVTGTYSGLKIEDIQAETQCIVRTIPAPADFGWRPPSEAIPTTTHGSKVGHGVEEGESLGAIIEGATKIPIVDPVDFTLPKFTAFTEH